MVCFNFGYPKKFKTQKLYFKIKGQISRKTTIDGEERKSENNQVLSFQSGFRDLMLQIFFNKKNSKQEKKSGFSAAPQIVGLKTTTIDYNG